MNFANIISYNALMICILGLNLAGCNLERRVLFAGAKLQPAHAVESIPDDIDRLWVEDATGRIEVWFMPAQQIAQHPAPLPAGVILFAHGNGEWIDDWYQPLQSYRQWGFHVVLAEYRGYGRSTGKPSQKKITGDFAAVYDYIVTRPDVDPSRIIFHGRSLGGGVLLDLARIRHPAACILQSTFTSVPAVAARYSVPRSIIRNRFENTHAIAQLDCPLLILHGRLDQVVPFHHALQLQQAAPHAHLVTFDAGHNNLPMNDSYWLDLRHFLEAHELFPQKYEP